MGLRLRQRRLSVPVAVPVRPAGRPHHRRAAQPDRQRRGDARPDVDHVPRPGRRHRRRRPGAARARHAGQSGRWPSLARAVRATRGDRHLHVHGLERRDVHLRERHEHRGAAPDGSRRRPDRAARRRTGRRAAALRRASRHPVRPAPRGRAPAVRRRPRSPPCRRQGPAAPGRGLPAALLVHQRARVPRHDGAQQRATGCRTSRTARASTSCRCGIRRITTGPQHRPGTTCCRRPSATSTPPRPRTRSIRTPRTRWCTPSTAGRWSRRPVPT